jgi:hypothetical protein
MQEFDMLVPDPRFISLVPVRDLDSRLARRFLAATFLSRSAASTLFASGSASAVPRRNLVSLLTRVRSTATSRRPVHKEIDHD